MSEEEESEDQLVDLDSFAAIYGNLIPIAREHFPTFLYVVFPQNDDATYKVSDLHLFLANKVQQVVDEIISANQAVSVPPQHGKSRLLAVRAAAWLLGKKPGISIALTGFSRDLLTDFLSEIRNIMETPAYRRIFPGLEPVFGQDRADKMTLNNGSSIICKSAGSKLTGRRVDWLIIDDAHAGRAEAESALQRRRVIEWYFADCVTRLSKDAKVFIIGTRWHPDDLIGHLTSHAYTSQLEAEGQGAKAFGVTNLKAISDGVSDPLGRPEGAALFPEERPLSFLLGIKAGIPSYEWSSQFDGVPRTASSGQADLAKLRYITRSELPEGLNLSRGWDLAVTEKQTADFSAGALCGWDEADGVLYIVDIFRRQWAWTKMKPKLVSLAREDADEMDALKIAIEGVSAFTALVEDVRAELLGEVKVTRRNPGKGGKLLRAQPWLNLIEAGKVVIVRGPWNKDFLDELETFPDGLHDDQIDAVSIGFEDTGKKPKGKLLLA